MYYQLAFLAGVSAKLYDDFKDNVHLKTLKNKYVMELLKLFHMGAFVSTSFYNPLYAYIISFAVSFNIFGDTTCYKFVYEKCLFIAILLFFPFFDNSKIQIPSLSVSLSISFFVIISSICAYIEASVIKEEYSIRKLCLRIGGLVWTSLIYFYFLHIYDVVSLIQMYVLGYLCISVLVQCYCLFICVPKKIKKKENNNKRISK